MKDKVLRSVDTNLRRGWLVEVDMFMLLASRRRLIYCTLYSSIYLHPSTSIPSLARSHMLVRCFRVLSFRSCSSLHPPLTFVM